MLLLCLLKAGQIWDKNLMAPPELALLASMATRLIKFCESLT